jgi:hypothetical protein
MPATQTVSHLDGSHPADGNPPTFESVWAGFQETDRMMKEHAQKMVEFREGLIELRESQKEYALHLKETERILKEKNTEFYEKLGHLTNLFGDVTEAMVAPKICEKFEELGLYFPQANPNVRINDRRNNISFEIDIMLENGDKAMLIEVKTKLTIERINYHLSRLEKMRKFADLRGDKRIFLGAVAGIVVTDEIRDYALSQGFYFIEYAGDNFFITSPSGKPKEW